MRPERCGWERGREGKRLQTSGKHQTSRFKLQNGEGKGSTRARRKAEGGRENSWQGNAWKISLGEPVLRGNDSQVGRADESDGDGGGDEQFVGDDEGGSGGGEGGKREMGSGKVESGAISRGPGADEGAEPGGDL